MDFFRLPVVNRTQYDEVISHLPAELIEYFKKFSEKLNLPDRELQVLRYIIDEALTDKEISEKLGIGKKTVSNLVTTLLRRFGVSSRTELVLLYNKLTKKE